MAVGNRISTLLGERRESIMDFSKGSGISYPVAFNLYHGKGNGITWEVMDKVCHYFSIGPGELFPWKESNFQEEDSTVDASESSSKTNGNAGKKGKTRQAS